MPSHVARGCFLARVGVAAALVWRGTDLRGRIVGGANETTHDRSGRRGRDLMRVVLALAVLILGSTGGEIAITHGMKATREPARFRPLDLLHFLGHAMAIVWFW